MEVSHQTQKHGEGLASDATVIGVPLPKRDLADVDLSKEALSGDLDRLRAIYASQGDNAFQIVSKRVEELLEYRSDLFSGERRELFLSQKGAEAISNYICLSEDENYGGAKGIDRSTISLIELDEIWGDMVDDTGPLTRATITRSFLNPHTSAIFIAEKQRAYQELSENPEMKEAFKRFTRFFGRACEGPLLCFLESGWEMDLGYGDYAKTRTALKAVVDFAEKLPEAKSPYLRMIREDILALRDTEVYKLLDKGMMRTEQGFATPEEAKSRDSKKRFIPWDFTRHLAYRTSLLFGTGAAMLGTFGYMMATTNLAETGGTVLALEFVGGVYAMGVGAYITSLIRSKRGDDQLSVADPLRQMAMSDPKVDTALDAVGRIGELAAGLRYMDKAKVPLVFPKVREASHHYFRAKEMRSPLFIHDPSYVPSDVDISQHSLIFLTGPNSGGKTTFARALQVNQIMAQIGLPLPVKSAEIGISESTAYQAPEFSSQDSEEGRFGTEFGRTRDIVYGSSARSFNILDELAEGTTPEEKWRHSRAALETLAAKGCTTILITHDLELVRFFEKLGYGGFFQVEFRDGTPTHKVIPGISESSHADRIAQKIRFSVDDMRQHLSSEGYTKN